MSLSDCLHASKAAKIQAATFAVQGANGGSPERTAKVATQRTAKVAPSVISVPALPRRRKKVASVAHDRVRARQGADSVIMAYRLIIADEPNFVKLEMMAKLRSEWSISTGQPLDPRAEPALEIAQTIASKVTRLKAIAVGDRLRDPSQVSREEAKAQLAYIAALVVGGPYTRTSCSKKAGLLGIRRSSMAAAASNQQAGQVPRFRRDKRSRADKFQSQSIVEVSPPLLALPRFLFFHFFAVKAFVHGPSLF